ncbi:hypothetical protein ACFY1U_45215 [Streptomyces sp. NPDC001351]|uniref:hypothetical protein n=1 Tax=Streptomyces sp. NPDC001351 TaxID=3364564 RepID=UPI0036A3B9F7
MSTEFIIGELLEEGLDDWAPIDRLIGLAQETAEQAGSGFRVVSVEVLTELLSGGLMAVGDLGRSGFKAWSGSPEALVRRVVAMLDGFDWRPQGGACWLADTRQGTSEGPRQRVSP